MNIEKVYLFSMIESSEIKRLLMAKGFNLVQENPDFVLSYGGDGTALLSERAFPEIPKLIVKKSNICRKCDYYFSDLDQILTKLIEGNFDIKKEIKLEVITKKAKLTALNEIQIRAKSFVQALRFSVIANSKEFSNLIGDGIIVATPFGSTGYYKSTGGKKFSKGIGLSFNNLHNKKIESIIFPPTISIKTEIHRGPALVMSDNSDKYIELKKDEFSTIRKSDKEAKLIQIH